MNQLFSLVLLFALCAAPPLSHAAEWNSLPSPAQEETRIAFGSCIYYPDSPVWASIARQTPDIVLLLGDNVYLRGDDLGDFERTAHRYELLQSNPDFQALERNALMLATWDDHDFGPNNSNRFFAGREQSLRAHRKYWNRAFTKPFPNAVSVALKVGKLKIILADNRSFREDPGDESAHHFGPKQMDWIRQLTSTLRSNELLIFASGGQILSPPGEHYETLGHYPQERAEFRALLQNIPSATVILSGDRHYPEVLQLSAHNKTLWELTSSPLSAKTVSPKQVSFYKERVFTLTPQRNFGLLTINWNKPRVRAWVEYYSDIGKQLVRYELTNLTATR